MAFSVPSPKKILFLTTVANTLRAFLLPLARELRRRGWEVDAGAARILEFPVLREVFGRRHEISWNRTPLHPGNLKAFLQIRRLIGQYDIVHVHTPIASVVTRLARPSVRGCKGSLIYTAHGFHFHALGRPAANRLYLAVEKLLGRWTDYLIVINDEDEWMARARAIVPSRNLIHLAGIGIDTRDFDPAKVTARDTRALRDGLHIGPDVPIITMAADFFAFKHHDDVIRAVPSILKQRDVVVVFAGDGPLFGAIRQSVESRGLGRFFRFPGYFKDMRTLFKASSIVVTMSTREGLSRSVMEALSMQKPVIGTAIRGTRELLSAGCGSLIPPRSSEELAKAVLEILEDPDKAGVMGTNGRSKMTGRYESSHIIEAHLALYAEALERSGDRPPYLRAFPGGSKRRRLARD